MFFRENSKCLKQSVLHLPARDCSVWRIPNPGQVVCLSLHLVKWWQNTRQAVGFSEVAHEFQVCYGWREKWVPCLRCILS